jgi:cytochrome P450
LDLEETHFQNLLKALPTSSDDWTATTDLLPLFFRLTMDSASEFLFGRSVNTQLNALPNYSNADSAEDAAFVSAFEDSQDHIAKAFRLNDWWSLGITKAYRDRCAVVHRYIDKFVQEAISKEKRPAIHKSGKEKYVFAEALAQVTSDPIEMRDQMLSILIAGRDTTASLLCFLWLSLSNHQQIFKRLRQAVLDDFGTYEQPRNLSFSSLKACSYLQWCLNEALR